MKGMMAEEKKTISMRQDHPANKVTLLIYKHKNNEHMKG